MKPTLFRCFLRLRRWDLKKQESNWRTLQRAFCNKWLPGLVLLGLFLVGGAPAASAQNFQVNSTADRADQKPGDGICATGNSAPDGSGNPECTLRAAIQESNADAGEHQITVPAGTYALTLASNCVVAVYNGNSTGTITLCMSGQITISGAGAT